MILVDTSIWIDHLRSGDEHLAALLQQNQVLMHPMILGELACGSLQNRAQLLFLWMNLPQATVASHQETLYCLEQHKLMGRGIGYVDTNLLASVLLMPGTRFWTRDKRLATIAGELGMG